MDFDKYWKDLVNRVYRRKDVLRGPEELVYRLTCIYGETMVDGIEAYFERRFDEYDRDIAVLMQNGFTDIAADFGEARQILFGDSPLNEATITPVLDRLLDEDEAFESERRQIGAIYDRLIERLPELLGRRDEIGIANGLFAVDAEPLYGPRSQERAP
jgi:hypothetical protein